ncbi:MAG: DUF4834 family protein [Bacteroidales bacterium]|nr:DUF4834 family protein [Bacteroidales bacterium]
MGFIRILLIIVIVYYLWTLVSRFILVPLLQGYFGNAASGSRKKQYQTRKEGDTHITANSPQKKFISKDRGEYVDFEEIKD